MKRTIISLLLIMIITVPFLFSSCSKEESVLKKNGYIEDVQTVSIPGLTKTYKILWVSDLHILFDSDEVSESDRNTVLGRIDAFKTSDGLISSDNWDKLTGILDAEKADLIVFGGDMMDFCSEKNIECLTEGLKKLKTPYIYLRGDHDNSPYYLASTTYEECAERHNKIGGNENIISYEFPEFIVVGFNDSTRQLTEEGLTEAKRLFALGKPIILMTHVPFDSLIEDGLADQSNAVFGNRVLLWGIGDYYNPNEITKEFINMVISKDSPVAYVFAGHMHFKFDETLNGTIMQHVFNAAAFGEIGVIEVK